MTPRLYTFMISHYAEKARWALDYKGVEYREVRLLPGMHFPVIKRIAPGTSVPVLVDGDRIVQGSSAIIDYADERWPDRPLTPSGDEERARAIELEAWLDRELGETLRRVFYFHALPHKRAVVALFSQGGPFWAPLFYGLAFGTVAGVIRRMYAITEENVAVDRGRLDAVFERLEGLLDDRRYLSEDRFTRADLTLAALAAPMWDPPEHPTKWPPTDIYPPEVLALRARFVSTRAHDHVMRMYREHRRTMRPAGRDRPQVAPTAAHL
jgi:glutathione S-transferase